MNNNEKIESILNSIEDMEQSAPRPFFFTRLEARMNRHTGSQTGMFIRFITRPAVAIAAVMLIILINAYAIFFSARSYNTANNNTTEIASIDEYAQLSSNYYDTEKPNP